MPEPTSKYSFNGFISYPISNYINNILLCKKISANCITFIGNIFSIIVIYSVYKNPCNYKLIFILTFIRAFLDILDGSVARICKDQSEYGALFDSINDFIYGFSFN